MMHHGNVIVFICRRSLLSNDWKHWRIIERAMSDTILIARSATPFDGVHLFHSIEDAEYVIECVEQKSLP